MDLPTYQQLLQQTSTTANRYAVFRGHFKEFAAHAAALSGNQSPVPLSIQLHLEQDYFDARFAGRDFRFSLGVSLPEQGIARAKVVCKEIISGELRPVLEFSMTSNVKGGAWYLVLYAIRVGMSN